MATEAMRAMVEAIHASSTQAVIYAAGGGSQALGWLLTVPRASNTVLEVLVPYSRLSMIQVLGKEPARFASMKTAEDVAMAAYNRALKLSTPGTAVVGIGLTGALASHVPKRGEHRCHVSARTRGFMANYELVLAKGQRDRHEEDNITSFILVKALADACGVSSSLSPELVASEKLVKSVTDFTEDQQIAELIDGLVCMLVYSNDSGKPSDGGGRVVVLPGSFNPLHHGHLELMDVACSIVQNGLPCFEISVVNADKPPLALEDIKNRVEQFRKLGKTVILTDQPYFYKKAELFPDSTFVIGVDTALRLINPNYYDGSYNRMVEVLLGIQKLGCDFLVAGRKFNGEFQDLSGIHLPKELQGLFKSIPEDVFRVDVSSTEIREKSSLKKY